jgi:hypothetical protein
MTDVNNVSILFKNTNPNIAYQSSNTIHDLLKHKNKTNAQLLEYNVCLLIVSAFSSYYLYSNLYYCWK